MHSTNQLRFTSASNMDVNEAFVNTDLRTTQIRRESVNPAASPSAFANSTSLLYVANTRP